MPTNNENSGLPNHVHNLINEHTNGGFILFFYDENGIPKQTASFDSIAHGLGMQTHINIWSSSVAEFSVQNLVDQIRKVTGEIEE